MENTNDSLKEETKSSNRINNPNNLSDNEILYEIYSCVHTIRIIMVIYAILFVIGIIILLADGTRFMF